MYAVFHTFIRFFYRIGLIDVPEKFGQNMEEEEPDK